MTFDRCRVPINTALVFPYICYSVMHDFVYFRALQ